VQVTAPTAIFGLNTYHNMTTRIIEREFVVQNGYDTLTPRSDPRWGSFQNTYAAWTSSRSTVESITIRRKIELQKGYYYVTGTVDNSGSVVVNGTVINLFAFNTSISRTDLRTSTRIYHGGGLMDVVINARNAGDVAGVAVTISEELSIRVYYELVYRYEVGNLVWSTRTAGTADSGRYVVTMPFKAEITAYAWCAGGGGGGNDSGTIGGLGSPGLYNTTVFQVDKGDLLEVFVGKGGRGGGSNSGGAPGGSGGSSRISINGDSTKSFNGGRGSNSGPRPWSGAGGGGGGASGILVNNTPVLVAAGGGGGGGAGNDGNSAGTYARRDAAISKNAISATGSDYRGENGETKGGDGGGAGGGGGGYPGGQGGRVVGGDASGFAGQCGGNFPIFAATTGIGTAYYKAGYSAGGSRTGGSGQPGRVFLLIEPIGLNSVKVGGAWKQINEIFVKVSGSWKEIDYIYVKVGNNWKQINGSGQKDITLDPETTFYGTSARSYS